MTKFYLGELFCGPGGMALGAKLASEEVCEKFNTSSIEHVWGVDKDKNAIETFSANGLGEGVHCDAMDFVTDVGGCCHRHLSDFERINALAFGFPCNDFSTVGERRGVNGKFGQLYKAGVRVLNACNPLFFVAENVSGINSANSDAAFHQILSELSEAGQDGYNLTTHLYKFEEYGVPQMRHRYLIVGIRKDLDVEFKVPAPTHSVPVSAGVSLSQPYSVNPILNSQRSKQDPTVTERLLFIPPWQNAWLLDELVEMSSEERRQYLEKHLPWYNEHFALASDDEILDRILACKLNCKKARMSHIYRRLDFNKPAYTVTGSGGGGTHVYHWEECRSLTNRERARLQSFPDHFEFKGGIGQIRKQIGMAVPPIGAKVIFRAILDCFDGREYRSLKEPSYQPMSDDAFIAYRRKRYVARFREKLRVNYQFESKDFQIIKPIIASWVDQNVPYSEAEQRLIEEDLLELNAI